MYIPAINYIYKRTNFKLKKNINLVHNKYLKNCKLCVYIFSIYV